MARIFTHPDGTLNPYPFSKEEARRRRSMRYDDHEPCVKCRDTYHTKTSIKYVHSDRCIHCAFIEAGNFYNLTIGKPCRIPIMDEMVDALSLCHDGTHAVMRPCAKAGHFGVQTPDGDCLFCEQDRRNTPPSPRKIAQRKGDLWYTPDTPCIHCGQKALKRVNNGACQGCNPKREPPAQLPADTILTRADAKLLALKMYRTGRPCHQGHTGFRYTSTGGCVACTNGGGL